jgi:protein ImuB
MEKRVYGALFAAEGTSPDALAIVAREFSPRVEICSVPGNVETREMTLDLSGLSRLFGDARTIGQEMRRTAADHGLRVRVAIASTRTAARLHAHFRAGLTVIDPGTEAASLAPLPVGLLSILDEAVDMQTVKKWGLRTLGDMAALPADEVAVRLGQNGVRWQRLARGEDERPLVPAVVEERFEQSLDLEWPIDGLEPLSFVLGRLMEPLSAHLERRGRGAAVLHVRLRLVTRDMHERSLELPAPMRDARTLRTLALLDLESNPPPAAIDRVTVAVDPTPGRVLQFSLLTRPLPSPEQLSTLMARLTALMGEGRCGSPVELDSWQPGVFGMKAFGSGIRDPGSGIQDTGCGIRDTGCGIRDARFSNHEPRTLNPEPGTLNQEFPDPGSPIPDPGVALRRFRFPVPARVLLEHGKPRRVTTDRRGLSGGRVVMCAGPWRTSGGWWGNEAGRAGKNFDWDRDEWDVTLGDGATYRIFRDRALNKWFIEGIVD